ncbi:hypothetical protein K144313037_14980 [Clostridium tetani]|uniref:Uncharacterized protein n=2 Tax=Clostridium tetani TaxID=1513 RepID=Q893W7_CLOTE|nr:hypothetical protein [Clostridium tetani]AAO36225.1 hypothetical protein CTC_01690 [Clostridium tetani E88]AVP54223.1 hypothetical protein C3B72_03450 [Clostridium tetani]RXI45915.1 hypothetical protein DP126_06910 [Clostridium tetani]RXI49532.1 hypothetical protein DP130_05605 [Clostridium tetani]RXI51005.1 hypothetical protein DP122_12190 [Clostridium tetani]
MIDDKLIVDKNILKKIQSRATGIKITSKEKPIIKDAEEIIQIIDKILEDNSITLVEKIEQKMRDVRYSDPEMNANLYILHRKLVDGKINHKDADNLFHLYINSEPFDKKVY